MVPNRKEMSRKQFATADLVAGIVFLYLTGIIAYYVVAYNRIELFSLTILAAILILGLWNTVRGARRLLDFGKEEE